MNGLPLFHVIDTTTGSAPDVEQLALNEPWAKGLIYCDMEGWAVQDDGSLLLMDECGNWACPPAGRFRVEWLRTPGGDA